MDKFLLAVRIHLLRFNRIISTMTPAVLQQVLFFGGLAAMAFGFWMVYRPLGPIVGGGFSLWVAVLIALERSDKTR